VSRTLRRTIASLLVAVSLTAVLGACSDDSSVGQGVDTDFEEKLNDQLGATTTTTAAAGDGDAAQTTTTAAAGGGVQATTTTTVAGFEIGISSTGFDPVYSRVLPGTIVTFKNNDSQARSAVGDNGEFDTGSIAPGATATFKAPGGGVINFSDGTRPFVTGTIEVTG
jgi:plastocyanin